MLEPYYTHAPKRIAVCQLWMTDPIRDKMVLLLFAAMYAGRKCLDTMLNGREYEQENENTLLTEDGFYIRSPEMEKLLNYKLSVEEEAFNFERFCFTEFRSIRQLRNRGEKAQSTENPSPIKEAEKPKEKKVIEKPSIPAKKAQATEIAPIAKNPAPAPSYHNVKHKDGSRKGQVHACFDSRGSEEATKLGIKLGLSPGTLNSWIRTWQRQMKG